MTLLDIMYNISRIPIRTAFPDYTGKAQYDESLDFIKARFKEQRKHGPVTRTIINNFPK